MSKLCAWLLAAWPFLAFMAWTVGWLVTDALRERRHARAAARACREIRQMRSTLRPAPGRHNKRVRIVIHNGAPGYAVVRDGL